MARRRAPDHPARRGEDLPRAQGQGRPRGVPEDLLGAARPGPGHAAERVPGRVPAHPGRACDTQFKVAGTRGSETDCGRVFILLGKPDEDEGGAGRRDGDAASPETWTYRDRPARLSPAGEAKINFSGHARCRRATASGRRSTRSRRPRSATPTTGTTRARREAHNPQRREAEAVAQPRPLSTPAPGLPDRGQRKMFMTAPERQTRTAPVCFTVEAPPGRRRDPIEGDESAVATDATGRATATPDREMSGAADPTNHSFHGLPRPRPSPPGPNDVKIAMFDPASGKGSVANVPLTVTGSVPPGRLGSRPSRSRESRRARPRRRPIRPSPPSPSGRPSSSPATSTPPPIRCRCVACTAGSRTRPGRRRLPCRWRSARTARSSASWTTSIPRLPPARPSGRSRWPPTSRGCTPST